MGFWMLSGQIRTSLASDTYCRSFHAMWAHTSKCSCVIMYIIDFLKNICMYLYIYTCFWYEHWMHSASLMIIYAICCFYIAHVYNISISQTELYSEESTRHSPCLPSVHQLFVHGKEFKLEFCTWHLMIRSLHLDQNPAGAPGAGANPFAPGANPFAAAGGKGRKPFCRSETQMEADYLEFPCVLCGGGAKNGRLRIWWSPLTLAPWGRQAQQIVLRSVFWVNSRMEMIHEHPLPHLFSSKLNLGPCFLQVILNVGIRDIRGCCWYMFAVHFKSMICRFTSHWMVSDQVLHQFFCFNFFFWFTVKNHVEHLRVSFQLVSF